MRNNLFRDAALLVAAVLLTTAFWSCSKSKEEAPEPTPPAVSVTGVTLNKTTLTLAIGGSETLTATVAPADATNQNVTWKSDKPEIATINANGKVTGVAAGEATITVTTEEGGKTATCKVTVKAATVAVADVKLNKTELTLEVDWSETLTVTVAPADATNQNVMWKSDKPEIVSVDDNGKVTGVAIGEATITVTTEDGGKTATCKVAVKVPDVEGVYWFEEGMADELVPTVELFHKGQFYEYYYAKEGMADELVPTVELFHKGQFYEYYYAKTDEAVAYLKKETGIITIKKGDLVLREDYPLPYTITKNEDGTSGTIKLAGGSATIEYSELSLHRVVMAVVEGGGYKYKYRTAESFGFPINRGPK